MKNQNFKKNDHLFFRYDNGIVVAVETEKHKIYVGSSFKNVSNRVISHRRAKPVFTAKRIFQSSKKVELVTQCAHGD